MICLSASRVFQDLCACLLNHFRRVWLFAFLWTITHQAPLSMGFSRQEYWGGLPFPLLTDLPNPGIKPISIISPALAGRVFISSATWEVLHHLRYFLKTVYLLCNCNKMKVAQSCPTLCDPMDYTVHGILQARILEWVAMPFSRGSSQPRDWTQVSCIAWGFFTGWATREARVTVIIIHHLI